MRGHPEPECPAGGAVAATTPVWLATRYGPARAARLRRPSRAGRLPVNTTSASDS